MERYLSEDSGRARWVDFQSEFPGIISRKRWPNWPTAGGGHHLSKEGGELQVSVWNCSVQYTNIVAAQESGVTDVTIAVPLDPMRLGPRPWSAAAGQFQACVAEPAS